MVSAVEFAVDTFIRASRERNPRLRAQLLADCFAEDGRMVTRSREIRGRAALADLLTKFHADPEWVHIRMLSAVDADGTTFRYRARTERRDGTGVESFDAGEIDAAGQISLLLTFAGPLGDAAEAQDNGKQ